MSVGTYYRWTLALPLAVPALLSPLMLVGDDLPDPLRTLLGLLFYSVIIGGVPYVLFAAGFLGWMRGKSDREVRVAILVAPLLYTAVLFICLTLFFALDDLSRAYEALGALTAFACLFGYGYVGLAELGRAVLRPGESVDRGLLPS